jgi:hypothetical protein
VVEKLRLKGTVAERRTKKLENVFLAVHETMEQNSTLSAGECAGKTFCVVRLHFFDDFGSQISKKNSYVVP